MTLETPASSAVRSASPRRPYRAPEVIRPSAEVAPTGPMPVHMLGQLLDLPLFAAS